MRRVVTALALVLLVPTGPSAVHARSPKQIKVALEFSQSEFQSGHAVQGSGGVIVTERRKPRAGGSVSVDSSQRKVTRSTGMFTIVQDGGESMLLVASQVPFPDVAYYRDALARAGYLATGVAFKDVGTSLKVRARVLPGNQIQVRLIPTVSWFAHDRSGITEVIEASTELIVPIGRPVSLGGATTQLHELTRHILGVAATHTRTDSLLTVTATLVE